MEKPVIATNVGGIPELIKDNDSGFLINKSAHQELVDKAIVFPLLKAFTIIY